MITHQSASSKAVIRDHVKPCRLVTGHNGAVMAPVPSVAETDKKQDRECAIVPILPLTQAAVAVEATRQQAQLIAILDLALHHQHLRQHLHQ